MMGDARGIAFEDRVRLMDLYARYAWALDGGETDALVECFTPDAVMHSGREISGHDKLREWHKNFGTDPGNPGGQHFASQFRVVEAGKDWARTRVYVIRFHRIPGTTQSLPIWQGYYTDLCVKVGGQWYYKEKKAHEAEELRQQRFGTDRPPATPRFADLGGTMATGWVEPEPAPATKG